MNTVFHLLVSSQGKSFDHDQGLGLTVLEKGSVFELSLTGRVA